MTNRRKETVQLLGRLPETKEDNYIDVRQTSLPRARRRGTASPDLQKQ
jgi:hypothetical protein